MAEHKSHANDALWDARGELPADLADLQARLGGLPLPPEPDWGRVVRRRAPVRVFPMRFVWAAAAAVLVAALAGEWLVRDAWMVDALQGRARWQGPVLAGRLPVGSACRTDAGSRVRIEVGRIGDVELEPGSLLRRVAGRRGETRLALEHGVLHARISAPPRAFVVETPSGVATDLGCAYTLAVDDAGAGSLRVTEGRVAFTDHGRESFLPAGTWCPLTAEGAGLPRRDWASDRFLSLLAEYDQPDCDTGTLDTVLAAAEASDAISLWHLLPRVAGDERRRVALRLAGLVGLPGGTSIERIMGLEPAALDALWASLGMGEAGEWRSGEAWKGERSP